MSVRNRERDVVSIGPLCVVRSANLVKTSLRDLTDMQTPGSLSSTWLA